MFAQLAKIIGLLRLLPDTLKAIKDAVDAFEVKGHGSTKREAVKRAIAATFNFGEKAVADTPLTETDVTSFVDRVWDIYEWFCVTVGKFGKSAADAEPVTPPVTKPEPEQPADSAEESTPA